MASFDDKEERSSILRDYIGPVLPLSANFRLYHLSTKPKLCTPLFGEQLDDEGKLEDETTFRELHFLGVTLTEDKLASEIFVFGLEVYIYFTRNLTTIFIAKADSTGYLNLLDTASRKSRGLNPSTAGWNLSVIQAITHNFCLYVKDRVEKSGCAIGVHTHPCDTTQKLDLPHHDPPLTPRKPLMIALFARAQDQYIFPGSVDNPLKHVTSDRKLINWWVQTLSPFITDNDKYTQAYLLVPGEDSISNFISLPSRNHDSRSQSYKNSSNLDKCIAGKWVMGHPLRRLFPRNLNLPIRCMIPLFPDDPKARFVDELDESLTEAHKGSWPSINSLDQFWQVMEFRQECSSGRQVGFLWLVFGDNENNEQYWKFARGKATQSATFDPVDNPKNMQENFLAYYAWPTQYCGELILTDEQYSKAIEIMEQQDFSELEVARTSTKAWINKVNELAVANIECDASKQAKSCHWGVEIKGQATRSADASAGAATTSVVNFPICKPNVQHVNFLTSNLIRRKRKVESNEIDDAVLNRKV